MTNNGNPGCLGALFGLRGGAPEPLSSDALPYRPRDDFLSPAELSFYRALVTTVGGRVVICPKVNLRDILFVARPNENKGAHGRISQKHVDFLVCDPNTMRPLMGIELDDSSHQRQDRQARDEFVDSAFNSASLPLVHVGVRASYVPAELAAIIGPHLAAPTAAPVPSREPVPLPTSAPAVSPIGSAPACPKCGIPMVLRLSGRGDRQGKHFYGCTNYPKCRETAQL
jgi:hypothetical protein